MLRALIGFELRQRAKLLSTWVYALVLFGAGLFMMLVAAGAFRNMAVASGSERVYANGPHQIFATTTILALLGIFTVAAVFGQAAWRDFGTGMWPIVFTRRLRKSHYLLGRFLGAFTFSALLFLCINLGQLTGALVVDGLQHLGFLDSALLGPHRLAVYLWPYVVSVWPMLFFSGALFFCLASLTRSMAPVYVGVVVLVLGYLVLSSLLGNVERQHLAGMLDPLGLVSFDLATRYWTPAERNTDLVPLAGLLLANRALWAAVGVALLGLTVARFKMAGPPAQGGGSSSEEAAPPPGPLPRVLPSARAGDWLRTTATSAWLMFRDVLRSPVYWSFVVAGLAFVLIGILSSEAFYGTATLPVTWQVLELARSTFGLFFIITVTFYAGELVWKDRDASLGDIVDAARVPGWVLFTSRVAALWLVAASLELVVGLAALTVQLVRGPVDIGWAQYATELLLLGLSQDLLLCGLALAVQMVLNHKYLGHGVMVLFFVGQLVLSGLGLEDPLLRYGSEPSLPYSDMNGYGHWVPSVLVFRGLWWAVMGVMLAVAAALMVRGREGSLRLRLARARQHTGPRRVAVVGALMLAALGLGGFITWQTRVAHRYQTAKDQERLKADYEKRYREAWLGRAQPRVVAVDDTYLLYPEESVPRAEVRGTWTLENKSGEPITQVLLALADDAKVRVLRLGDTSFEAAAHDEAMGLWTFTLPSALEPGARLALAFDLEFRADPLVHGTHRRDVVGNGTFFNNGNLPVIGYVENAELSEDSTRKSYGLAPKERMRARDDPQGLANSYIRSDSDFITYAATVCTVPGQLGIAPGYLEREWDDGGRHCFRYVMDSPMLNFSAVLSARYEVRRDEWNGVRLEVYFDPAHPTNVDRMMDGMKDALAFATKAFGPYQHRQLRILEFPRYASFAQSLPNTVPYSEAVGFIARVRDGDPDDIDFPYYVTAHEVAHQWWGHQAVGADVRGATMTSETMAQYTALMVMKERFGPSKMRRFLKYELDRYLMGRALERKKELPLALNENQAYIHYNKGSVVMYALQDALGGDTVNRALRRYLEAVRFRGPPYTTSKELVDFLREEAPDAGELLDDSFERITLYDNRALSATMAEVPGGWAVTLKVRATKLRADEAGAQKEVDLDEAINVGALDADGVALFIEKQRLHSGEQEVRFTVPTRPAKVGIDPLNTLVDRTSDDNTVTPTEGG